MSKLGKLGVAFIAALTLVGVVGMPAAAPAPIVFSPTPVAGWSTNGIVKAVLAVGDTVYAGGTFTQVQSTDGAQTLARANLAAFDIHTGAIRTGFSADTNGRVLSLASDGTHLFVGGDYTTIGGKARTRLASLDPATGAVSTTFTGGATSNIYALRVKDNRLYVGGSFGTLNGVTRPHLGAVDTTTGAVDPNFNPAPDNTVHSVVTSPDGSIVYVGGDFVNIGGAAHSYLAAVTATTGAVTGVTFQYPNIFDPTQPPSVLDLDISPSGDRVFAALAGLENQAASWSATTGQKQWSYVVDGDTQAVRYYQGNVYFGFHEGAGGDDTVHLLAVDAATGVLNNSFRPNINSFFGTWDIDVSPATNTLVVGGEFTIFNGVTTHGVALLQPGSTDPVAPTAPGTPTVTASSGTSLTLSWAPGTDNQAVAGYRVLRNGVEVAYPTTTTYTDSFLTAGTDYSYSVQTVDAAGNLSPPSPTIIGRTGVVIVTPGSTWRYLDTGVNQGTAWRAGAFSDAAWKSGAAELGYGDGDEATVVGYGPDANHKYTTTYFRQQFNVANPADLGALTLRLIRDDGAVVYLNGTEIVRSNMPTGTITNNTFAVNNIDGIDETTWLTYNVSPALLLTGTNTLAVEIHQQWAGSSDLSFNLALEAARQQGPATPTNLHTTAITGTSATLAWTAPSGPVTSYNVYRNGTLVGSSPTASFTDPTLTSAQSYSYTVTAVGNGVESLPTAAISVATPDVVAPSTPTGLTAPTVGAAHVVVSWAAAADNVGVTGYDLLRNGVVVASTTGATTANDTTVAPLSSYSYTVRAKDAAGNTSLESDPLLVTTPDGSDFVAPSVPQNLRTTSRSTTQIALAWDASTDDTGVTGYIVTRNGVDLPATTLTTLTDTGLAAGTTYTYTVRATDAALNASNASAPLAAATHATTETLIAAKAVWKYTDDGIDRGTAWRAFTYNDTTWKSGAGILGYNQGGEGTVLNNGGAVQNLRYISHYFRKTITVSDTAKITGLTLSLLRTDGAVVYVNGVEVARDNMPAGTINFDTYAVNVLSTAERAQQIYHPFVIPPSALQEGNNVIAVSVHHAWRGGTDALSFDMQLTATYQ